METFSVRTLFRWPAASVLIALGGLAGPAADAAAQGFRWPDRPENLQVLEATGSELGAVMRAWTGALGVRCAHCHVYTGDNPGDLSTYTFESDAKPAKEKARVMVEMVREINRGLGAFEELGVPADERVRVTCVTCHRGNSRPVMIEGVVLGVLEAEGVDAAAARYRALRDRHYGGFVYDFGPGPLTGLAEELAADGRTDDAVALLNLVIEYEPTSYSTFFTLSEVLARAGRTADAIAALETAIEHAPERLRGFLQGRLEELRGG